jgi:hypothetical protein
VATAYMASDAFFEPGGTLRPRVLFSSVQRLTPT